MSDHDRIQAGYDKVKVSCRRDWTSAVAGNAILDLATTSLRFLKAKCSRVNLVSKVPDKRYFSYSRSGVVARPANADLMLTDARAIRSLWNDWINSRITEPDFARMSYTIALAPCLAMELFDRANKKGPATYFECYVGHIFANTYQTKPASRVTLPVRGKAVRMTMDFLFDIPGPSPKLHVPVKMSTRERVVQAWSH